MYRENSVLLYPRVTHTVPELSREPELGRCRPLSTTRNALDDRVIYLRRRPRWQIIVDNGGWRVAMTTDGSADCNPRVQTKCKNLWRGVRPWWRQAVATPLAGLSEKNRSVSIFSCGYYLFTFPTPLLFFFAKTLLPLAKSKIPQIFFRGKRIVVFTKEMTHTRDPIGSFIKIYM